MSQLSLPSLSSPNIYQQSSPYRYTLACHWRRQRSESVHAVTHSKPSPRVDTIVIYWYKQTYIPHIMQHWPNSTIMSVEARLSVTIWGTVSTPCQERQARGLPGAPENKSLRCHAHALVATLRHSDHAIARPTCPFEGRSPGWQCLLSGLPKLQVSHPPRGAKGQSITRC